MKFECNCKTEETFRQMVDETHKSYGFDFEVGARLWYTPNGWNTSIMIEFQISTQSRRDALDSEDEPDWFTAYEVGDENDTDVSMEIFTEAVEDFKLAALKDEMLDFAKRVEKIVTERIKRGF